ncbi:MAG: shikimate dehydrogenase [Gammaproteobacteria bacterium]
METQTRDLYAVMGNPVSHTKSPQIHQAFAQQTDQAIDYCAICVATGGFEEALWQFRARGGKGLNVTLPFKQEAYRLAGEVSATAQRAGAANTLWFDSKDQIHAENTDGIGLVHDIVVNHQRSLSGQRILLLGAGGAARGVMAPLLGEDPAGVWLVNRTVAKAEELARLFGDLGKIRPLGYERFAGNRFDVIINATSASLQGGLPPLAPDLLAPGACCYDMMYGDEDTPFVRWARKQGAQQAVDGLGMLVEQAAAAFYLWRGVRPDTQAVIAKLRERAG